ncbi:MAG: alpha/beta hydrolase [[Clostridium] fimetarium]|nr:alpha/beta hydrolase [Alistipes timonensis]MCM1406523.1 alpha/beta hydrolase [[Clostridium] fimetarium]
MRHIILNISRWVAVVAAAVVALAARGAEGWTPDILGDGYEARTVDQGRDYSGPVVSTIVRKLAPDSLATGRGVLYVHGFNDYFFNARMGDEFTARGYDFYAVDLRKYGRSIRPGQRMFEARSLREYFADIDSALVEMRRGGVRETVLMGHSTGGLISAYFMAETGNTQVDALVLNSPFLDWNLGWKESLVPLIDWWGGLFPGTRISQGESTAYAESLLKSDHGYWDYDTSWKLSRSPDVTAGWVRAISEAQHALRDGKADIRVPILLMYSDKSVDSPQWSEAHNEADGVLDVADIRRYGLMLGPDITCFKVYGGLHDLLLSRPGLLAALYPKIFGWLDRELPPVPPCR